MQRDAIDLGRINIGRLFRLYFFPTLVGMLSICAVTAADGIFIGRGVGSDALAAVNITFPPAQLLTGLALMLGMGASVVSAMQMARGRDKAARLNVTQALGAGSLLGLVFLGVTLADIEATARALGASPTLHSLVCDYMPWIFTAVFFVIWSGIGLFVVRLDGSPRYAMWCNLVPALLNALLDYLFIFPLDMGLRGAGIATCLSTATGGCMAVGYLLFKARTLRLERIKLSAKSLRLALRNLGYQCRIGISALLGEAAIGVLMILGNFAFLAFVGDDGVGAFSIACYYTPFVFMIGNAIAQSAQPILSYNYGLRLHRRVYQAERLAIGAALACGALVTAVFVLWPRGLALLFLDGDAWPHTVELASAGFPLFAASFLFFVFNLTAIGYFQSVKRVAPAVAFSLLRIVLLVPAFLWLPLAWGVPGIWLALAVGEAVTSLAIIVFYLLGRRGAAKATAEEARD